MEAHRSPVLAGRGATLVLLVLLISQGVQSASSGAYASVLTALSTDSSLTFVRDAVQAAGMTSGLGDEQLGDATLFLPSDAAFKEFFARQGITAEQLLGPANRAALISVLQLHVVPSMALLFSALPMPPQSLSTAMAVSTSLQDGTLSIIRSSRFTRLMVDSYPESSAMVDLQEITAGRAVIYIIDNVLLPSPLAVLIASTRPSPPAPRAAPSTQRPSNSPPPRTAPLSGASNRPPPRRRPPPPPRRQSPAASPAPSRKPAAAKVSLRTALQANARELSMAAKALSDAGVMTMFDYSPQMPAVTLFLPSNAAFARFLASSGVSYAQWNAEPRFEHLQALLGHHIVLGRFTSQALTAAGGKALAGLREFDSLRTEMRGSRLLVQGSYSMAAVAIANINAGNAIVHVIDDMLLPFPVPGISPVSAPTLLAALKASPDLSLLTAGAAIVAASVNPVLAAPGSAAALFAPTNDALTSGLAALGTTPDAFLQYRNAGAILKVLQYHLSLSDDGPLFTDDARPGPIMVPSLLAGAHLSLLRNASGVFVVGAAGSARVRRSDVLAGSGVLHTLDALLLPPGGL